MSRQIQIRRGSTAQHATFTGKIAEVTFDTDAKTLRVHDNEQVGGYPLARQSELDAADYVIASQLPTPSNNYTWYRKYKSGWVEQGTTTAIMSGGFHIVFTANLPIKLSNKISYLPLATYEYTSGNSRACVATYFTNDRTTANATCENLDGTSTHGSGRVTFFVCGMAE